MIEISTARRSATRVDRISPEEIEILHLLHTRYSGKPRAYIKDLDEDITSAKSEYPLLNQMEVRQRRWWIGHVLLQIGAEKGNQKAKYWRLKRAD